MNSDPSLEPAPAAKHEPEIVDRVCFVVDPNTEAERAARLPRYGRLQEAFYWSIAVTGFLCPILVPAMGFITYWGLAALFVVIALFSRSVRRGNQAEVPEIHGEATCERLQIVSGGASLNVSWASFSKLELIEDHLLLHGNTTVASFQLPRRWFQSEADWLRVLEWVRPERPKPDLFSKRAFWIWLTILVLLGSIAWTLWTENEKSSREVPTSSRAADT